MVENSFLKDPQLIQDLQRYKERDNHTNLLYLAGTWLYLAVVFGGAIGFFVWRAGSGLHWGWDVPVLVVAIALMGAGQHHLGALGHEGAHFSLFHNRLFNEVMADLCCMLPIFSRTDTYRAQHLAHHKYVNDPVRDPDQFQLQASGHNFKFPRTPRELGRLFVTQLWPLNQARYALARMKYGGAEARSAATGSPGRAAAVPAAVGGGSLPVMIGLVSLLVGRGDAWLLGLVPPAFSAAVLAALLLLPARCYPPGQPRCPIPPRVHAVMQVGTYHAMLTFVAWLAFWLGPRAVAWWALLWVAPLLTSFSLYMMIRQVLHHSNADRGWLTNSRNYFVTPLVRLAVFPFGQDLHLVHHMFSSIPHYNLRSLHRTLLRYAEYHGQQGVVVERIVRPRRDEPRHPTVVEILGPAYAPTGEDGRYADVKMQEVVQELIG